MLPFPTAMAPGRSSGLTFSSIFAGAEGSVSIFSRMRKITRSITTVKRRKETVRTGHMTRPPCLNNSIGV